MCFYDYHYIRKRSVVLLAKLTLRCLRIENFNIGGWELTLNMEFLKKKILKELGQKDALHVWDYVCFCSSQRSFRLWRFGLPSPEFWLSHFGYYSKVPHLDLCPSVCLPLSPPLSLISFLSPLISLFFLTFSPSSFQDSFQLEILHDFM